MDKREELMGLAALCALAVGCKPAEPLATLKRGEWECTASHPETTTTYVKVGNVLSPITSTRLVCDQYSRRTAQ